MYICNIEFVMSNCVCVWRACKQRAQGISLSCRFSSWSSVPSIWDFI